MKLLIKKFFNLLGFEIKKINNTKLSFDDIYKSIFNENIIVFDVGANKGQSIERFKKIFPNATIHAFEPIYKEYENLIKKYSIDKSIIINNFAFGEEKYLKEINLAKRSGISSFNEFNKKHKWLKIRSEQYNTNIENFLEGKEEVQVDTLDNYCFRNNIEHIDILKIDTQGYEDLVLAGAKETLKKDIISAIEL